jgi:hypothetical protein
MVQKEEDPVNTRYSAIVALRSSLVKKREIGSVNLTFSSPLQQRVLLAFVELL